MTSSQKQKKAKAGPGTEGSYSLEFLIVAKKEFDGLESGVRLQLLKKLQSRLQAPKVQADKLRGMPSCYKIKLRAMGIRLVYEVVDKRLVVLVIAVGRRDNNSVYENAFIRSDHD
jgi:mRNA interferase RelE/StbE